MEPTPEPSNAGLILLALMLFFLAGFLALLAPASPAIGLAAGGYAIAGGLVILATRMRR